MDGQGGEDVDLAVRLPRLKPWADGCGAFPTTEAVGLRFRLPVCDVLSLA
jgi:hypothetical protein